MILFLSEKRILSFSQVNAVRSYKALSGAGVNAGAAGGTFVIVDNSVVIRNDNRTVRTFFLAYLTADTAVCANGSCDLAAIL